ncbi:MAG: protein translocase subunit SecF [Candidatus Roizmanbacteria bacterium]
MIHFLKYKLLYLLISLSVIVIGFFYIFRFGLPLSIDFLGGSVVQYKIEKNVPEKTIAKIYEKNNIQLLSVKSKGSEYEIRSFPLDEKKEVLIRTQIQEEVGVKKISTLRFESVGASIGKETMKKTLVAALAAIVGILLYMTYAFKKFNHGVAAILAMLHDMIVLFGVYAIVCHHFGAQVDLLFVTAALTTLSFSVHDTIVVFDKIREYQRTSRLSIDDMADKALTETMGRSVNNSLTIVLMLIPLMLMGGDMIKFFATALLIGTITGTYSSPFVATPLLALLERDK